MGDAERTCRACDGFASIQRNPMKLASIFFLGCLSAAVAQVAPELPPVLLTSDSVTISGERFAFRQSVVELNIETDLGLISDAREQLKNANSEPALGRARGMLDRAFLDLACDIIAAENFAKKSDKMFSLLQSAEDTLKGQPLPARVVTPAQLYRAVAGRSFRDANGMPVKPGDISPVLTFGDLVAEAREQILLRSAASP